MSGPITDLDAFLAYAAQTTDYEQRQPRGGYTKSAFDTDRVTALVEALGGVHHAVPVVHVAGSKGKGSVVLMTEALAAAHGLRVGTFTSPHLTTLTERIRVDGAPIAEAALCAAANQVIAASERTGLRPTFFELMFLAAGPCFVAAGVDLAIYEVGVGGRLDATNTLQPIVSAITTIDLDHTHWLGETLAEIATEKAGILRAGVPAVVSPSSAEAEAAVLDHAAAVGTPVRLARREFEGRRFQPSGRRERLAFRGGPLSGDYDCAALGPQVSENAAVALTLCELLGEAGVLRIDPQAAARALSACRIPGRIEPIGDPPRILLDSAHTPRSGLALATAVAEHFGGAGVHLVTALLQGKPVTGVLGPLLPRCRSVIATEVPSPRTRPAVDTYEILLRTGLCPDVSALPEPKAALERALERAGPGELVVVTGSFYLAGLLRPVALEKMGVRLP